PSQACNVPRTVGRSASSRSGTRGGGTGAHDSSVIGAGAATKTATIAAEPMTRALILTASYGSGHNTAALSLASAFEREGVSAVVVDHFRDLVHPAFERATRGLYYWIIRHTPVVWGLAYALGDSLASDSTSTFGVTRVGADRLLRLLETLAPDVVVTV